MGSKFQHAPLKGYVYRPRVDLGPFEDAAPNCIVSVGDKKPPWLVVDHDIETIVVSDWPGTLWLVEVIEPVEQARLIASGQLGVPHTPAWAVRVIKEVATNYLFGVHGDEVCSIIHVATNLSFEQAAALGHNRHPDARSVNARAWQTWTEELDRGSLASLDDGSAAMIAPSVVVAGSPVGTGLLVLHDELWKRASSVSGLAAFESTDDETWLAEPWSEALSALVDTALACGAPRLMSPEDRQILLTAWNKVIAEER